MLCLCVPTCIYVQVESRSTCQMSSSIDFPPFVFEAGSLTWTWGLPAKPGQLGNSSHGSSCIHLRALGLQGRGAVLSFYIDAVNPKAGLHACMESTLPNDPHLHPRPLLL